MKQTEVRMNITDNDTYFVLGDRCRSDLLLIVEALQNQAIPHNWNKYDRNALDTMGVWLKEDRDFSERQWQKFGKMLEKFELPNNIIDFAESASWTLGERLTRLEMYEIMEARREKKRQAKLEETKKNWIKTETTFQQLFNTDK